MHTKPRFVPIRWIWRAVALSAGASACGDDTETGQLPTIGVTLDSVTWISPPADEQLWGIRDVLEIEGTTWALTSSKPLLHGFRDGARFAAIGMIGPGPLEMLSPKALLHGPEPGAVTVWDPGAERYVTYSGSDASLTTRAAPLNGGLVRPDIAAVTFGDPFRMGSVIGYAFGVRYGDRVLRGEDLWGGRLYRMRVPGDSILSWVDFASLPGASLRVPGAEVLGPVPLWDTCPDGRIAILDPISTNLYLVRSEWEMRDSVSLTWEHRPLALSDRVGYLVAQYRHETNDPDLSEEEVVTQAERVEREARAMFSAEEPLGVDLKCGPSHAWVQEFDGGVHPLGYGPVWRTISLDDPPDESTKVTLPPDLPSSVYWSHGFSASLRTPLGSSE